MFYLFVSLFYLVVVLKLDSPSTIQWCINLITKTTNEIYFLVLSYVIFFVYDDCLNCFSQFISGIIANFKGLAKFLESKGFTFESDTDTEVIPKLALYFYRLHPEVTFRELVELICYQLVLLQFDIIKRMESILFQFSMKQVMNYSEKYDIF